ncbi:MAG: hypothetical protein NTY90_01610 [Candidatus Micrarchaeota archaeon]|nr:hypothetical protein [Candidatus Micrarchaeota archaeon]
MAADENIETVIDRLVDFVKLKGRVSAVEAGRALGMSSGQVEGIARLLEDNGLVQVHYTLIGTELAAVGRDLKKKEGEKSRANEPGAVEAYKDFESFVKESEDIFEFLKEEVLKKMTAAESLLDRLEKEKLDENDKTAVRKELRRVTSTLNNFEPTLQKIVHGEKELRKRIREISKRTAAAERSKPGIWDGIRDFVAKFKRRKKGKIPAPSASPKSEKRKKLLERLSLSRKRVLK